MPSKTAALGMQQSTPAHMRHSPRTAVLWHMQLMKQLPGKCAATLSSRALCHTAATTWPPCCPAALPINSSWFCTSTFTPAGTYQHSDSRVGGVLVLPACHRQSRAHRQLTVATSRQSRLDWVGRVWRAQLARHSAPVIPRDASCECRWEKNFLGSCRAPMPPSTCRVTAATAAPTKALSAMPAQNCTNAQASHTHTQRIQRLAAQAQRRTEYPVRTSWLQLVGGSRSDMTGPTRGSTTSAAAASIAACAEPALSACDAAASSTTAAAGDTPDQ